jgi:hypothetical protein
MVKNYVFLSSFISTEKAFKKKSLNSVSININRRQEEKREQKQASQEGWL